MDAVLFNNILDTNNLIEFAELLKSLSEDDIRFFCDISKDCIDKFDIKEKLINLILKTKCIFNIYKDKYGDRYNETDEFKLVKRLGISLLYSNDNIRYMFNNISDSIAFYYPSVLWTHYLCDYNEVYYDDAECKSNYNYVPFKINNNFIYRLDTKNESYYKMKRSNINMHKEKDENIESFFRRIVLKRLFINKNTDEDYITNRTLVEEIGIDKIEILKYIYDNYYEVKEYDDWTKDTYLTVCISGYKIYLKNGDKLLVLNEDRYHDRYKNYILKQKDTEDSFDKDDRYVNSGFSKHYSFLEENLSKYYIVKATYYPENDRFEFNKDYHDSKLFEEIEKYNYKLLLK